jgi:hypothetical protein
MLLLRILLTLAYAVLLGAWAYFDETHALGTYDALHSTPFGLAFLGLTILTGFVVRRLWFLLALIGPLLSLGYLQVSGYISPWHDGVDPLLSPPGIALFFWLGLLLIVGIGLGRAWEHYWPALRRRPAARGQS